MNNPLDLFAWKVRSERKRQHLTQRKLAERLNMNARTIIDLETCQSNPKFETMALVAKEDRLSSQVQQNQRKNFLSTSKGVRKLRRFLGRLLIISTKCCRSSSVTSAKEVPFGKNCRSRPLVFSFVPRCQGE